MVYCTLMLTILFYIYSIAITTVFVVLSFLALVVCWPFDKGRRVVHELSRTLCMLFWHVPPLWRRRIEGLENVDPAKPYVIVLNHNSMVDIISLYFVPLNFRWVSKREVFRLPFMGQLLLLHGDIAIERGRGAESMHKVAQKGKMWLSRGVSVAIFPEGTRSKDGEIHRFKQGAFVLAKEAGVDVLPVVMNGTGDIFKGWFFFNWRHFMTVRVLPPVPAAEVVQADTAALAESVRGRMVAALAEIRAADGGNGQEKKG